MSPRGIMTEQQSETQQINDATTPNNSHNNNQQNNTQTQLFQDDTNVNNATRDDPMTSNRNSIASLHRFHGLNKNPRTNNSNGTSTAFHTWGWSTSHHESPRAPSWRICEDQIENQSLHRPLRHRMQKKSKVLLPQATHKVCLKLKGPFIFTDFSHSLNHPQSSFSTRK